MPGGEAVGVEIERKFLLASDAWRPHADAGTCMVQGYLVDMAAVEHGFAHSSVRVRIEGEQARLNIKSAQLGIQRREYEYPVPLADAEHMLSELCRGCLEKRRYRVAVEDHVFEIDEFGGTNAGLIVAELELGSVAADYPRPDWLGRDVSHLARYYNVHLIDHPWRDWSTDERAGMEVTSCS